MNNDSNNFLISDILKQNNNNSVLFHKYIFIKHDGELATRKPNQIPRELAIIIIVAVCVLF